MANYFSKGLSRAIPVGQFPGLRMGSKKIGYELAYFATSKSLIKGFHITHLRNKLCLSFAIWPFCLRSYLAVIWVWKLDRDLGL